MSDAGGDARRGRRATPGHGPVRTCIGCRRRASQAALIRLVRAPDGSLRVGRTEPGRGAWLCRGQSSYVALSCLDAAERRRAFARALRAPLRPGAVSELRSTLAVEPAAPRPLPPSKANAPAFDQPQAGG